MSIISVVHEIDDAISNYKKRNAILEKDMGWENGKVRDSRNYPEFVSRKKHIWEEYEAEAAGLRARLKREITAYHKRDEDITEADLDCLSFRDAILVETVEYTPNCDIVKIILTDKIE